MRDVKNILINKLSSQAYDMDIDSLIEFVIEGIENKLKDSTVDELTALVKSDFAMDEEEFEQFLSEETSQVP